MSLPVHLVPSLDGVGSGDVVEVEGDEAHHAVAVRRTRVGEQLVLTDGAGTAVLGEVSTTAKRSMSVTVTSVRTVPAPTPTVTVVQALPKGDRGELAVEVLIEVGVGVVVPWAADRSVATWKGERGEKALARWRATAREAAKQARRTWLPDVAPLASTAEVVGLVEGADLAVVLHEEAGAGLADLAVPGRGRILVVVGPEGGLTEEEVGAFSEAGAAVVRLGTEVLRTSTAGVAAVAALLSRTERWSAGVDPG